MLIACKELHCTRQLTQCTQLAYTTYATHATYATCTTYATQWVADSRTMYATLSCIRDTHNICNSRTTYATIICQSVATSPGVLFVPGSSFLFGSRPHDNDLSCSSLSQNKQKVWKKFSKNVNLDLTLEVWSWPHLDCVTLVTPIHLTSKRIRWVSI